MAEGVYDGGPMIEEFPYWVVAYYFIGPIEDPQQEVSRHREFCSTRDIASRIYISEQGINGQMSASREHAKEYIEWMQQDARFSGVVFKIHGAQNQVFPKKTIKYRPQLVAIDCDVDLNQRGVSLSPSEWKQMLEQKDQNTIVIDVRNAYEWAAGHFEGAELPMCDSFREFPAFAKALKDQRDPAKTKVMMYCTGGIRCEFYSPLLKKEGFEQIYQLDGGVIGYGLSEGSAHWKGKLFVFDDRLVVDIAEEKSAPISRCRHCQSLNDVYYNCANMDCNDLFFCCLDCLHLYKGCCSSTCMQKDRVRPYREDGNSTPFRKMTIPAAKNSC